jgi:hypothetical protein
MAMGEGRGCLPLEPINQLQLQDTIFAYPMGDQTRHMQPPIVLDLADRQ